MCLAESDVRFRGGAPVRAVGHVARCPWTPSVRAFRRLGDSAENKGIEGCRVALQHRGDLRNVAIVAHVDHGKTTLVDAMLWQSGAFARTRPTATSTSGSWTRWTSSARRASRSSRRTPRSTTSAPDGEPRHDQHHRHPRPRRLRRRGRARPVDGRRRRRCSSTRPRARCRRPGSCCARRCRRRLPVDPRHQQGRPSRRPHRRGRRRDLRAVPRPRTPTSTQIDFPIVYASAKAGRASLDRPDDGGMPDGADLAAAVRDDPRDDPGRRPTTTTRRCRRTSPTSTPRPYLGRLALCRVHNGTIRKGQQVAWCRADGTIERVKITELLMTEALERVPAESAGPGDIIAIAGIPEITIGETLADPDDPRPLPRHHGRRAVDLDDDRHQHLAAGRRVRHEAHRPAGQEPPRAGARRQRVDPRAAHRAPRHLGGAGPRRAAAGDPRRDHAPRGLRAHRRQAAGRHPHRRRQGARAGRSG